MCMCTCVQVRGQRQTSSQPLSTAGFKMSLLLELTGCAWLHWLASKPQRSLVYLPSPEIIACTAMAVPLTWVLGIQARSLMSVANVLLTAILHVVL